MSIPNLLMDAYFKKYGFVSQQLKSYNDFILNGLQQIIDESEPIIITTDASKRSEGTTTKYEIIFGAVELHKPTIKEQDGTQSILEPNQARLRNLTYSTNMFCNIKVRITRTDSEGNDTVEEVFSKESLGSLPIMMKSKLCTLYNKKL